VEESVVQQEEEEEDEEEEEEVTEESCCRRLLGVKRQYCGLTYHTGCTWSRCNTSVSTLYPCSDILLILDVD
tara:strand:+ start:864 stop:1079 length:216 start_codon:yes stop_codon:yes gene_type:complete